MVRVVGVLLAAALSVGCAPAVSVRRLPPMQQARTSHASAALNSRMVLVTGGTSEGTQSLATVERFDVVDRKWTNAPPMAHRRAGHTATSLADGSVLVVGGWDSTTHEFVGQAEVFLPSTAEWRAAFTLQQPRQGHKTIVLSPSRVLIVGGTRLSNASLPSSALEDADVEICDVKEMACTLTPSVSPGNLPAIAKLKDVIVVAGGESHSHIASFANEYSAVYDIAQERWTPSGLAIGYSGLDMVAMDENTAALTGSGDCTEIAATFAWSPGTMTITNANEAIGLAVFDATKRIWRRSHLRLLLRRYHTATKVGANKLLITGGVSTDIFHPSQLFGDVVVLDVTNGRARRVTGLNRPRAGHTATSVGRYGVLIIGGVTNWTSKEATADVELVVTPD